MNRWPYTTPSGHTYVEPTTYHEVQERVNDMAQAVIESWDQAEHPPEPTWGMIGLCQRRIMELRSLNAELRAQVESARSVAVLLEAELDECDSRPG